MHFQQHKEYAMFTALRILNENDYGVISRAYMARVEDRVELPLSSVIHILKVVDGYTIFSLKHEIYITSDNLSTITSEENDFDMVDDAVIRAVKIPVV